MPNAFAYLMLWAWPLVAATAFQRLAPARAVLCCALAGFLLLPSGFTIKLPGLPDFSKETITLLGIAITYFRHRRPRDPAPLPRLFIALMALLLVMPLFTVFTNGDPIESRSLFIPGLTLYDAIGMVLPNIILVGTVVIAARTLGRAEDHRELLIIFGAAMVIYSLPALLELRISPQLHRWVYGYHPSSFVQQVRAGGFRATVFLNHGLLLAMYLALAGAALLAVRKSSGRIFGAGPRTLSLFLFVVLCLQKSLGPLLLGGVANLLVLFARPRRQIAIAAALAGVFLAYPVLRAADAIPIAALTRVVADYSDERAQSFTTRTFNEDMLLAKANQRPLFGWGVWGRNRIYDFETGSDLSITDGAWIIILGTFGWAGYLGLFGMLVAPLLLLFRHRRQMPAETAGVAVLLAANLVDLIPNASLTPLTWVMAGALTGAVAEARRRERQTAPALATQVPAPA